MPVPTFLAFFFLTASFISLWLKKELKVWGSLFLLSLFFGFTAGHISWLGLTVIAILLNLWVYYNQNPNVYLFGAIVVLSMAFKLHLIDGFDPYVFTSKFKIGLENPLIGLFPLAFMIPLARSIKDWKEVFKEVVFGCLGIVAVGSLAYFTGALKLDFSLPSFMMTRSYSNLILTSIPEEAFFRGFVQETLSRYFKNSKLGKFFGLILASLLFTLAHLFWSPNLAILGFSFIAGLLYGSVYLFSKRIESAIITHFLFNLVHMSFFHYHA